MPDVDSILKDRDNILKQREENKTTGWAGEPANVTDAPTVQRFSIDDLFRHHSPNPEQQRRMDAVRMSARFLCETLALNVPPGADQQKAIEHLREAVFFSNAAITLNGRSL
jgi:hypothetical protein